LSMYERKNEHRHHRKRPPIPTIFAATTKTSSDLVVAKEGEEDSSKGSSRKEAEKSKTSPADLSLLFPETTTKSGRAWRAEELRLKSMSDLHKLWFVLLAERNKLLSERFEARKHKRRMAGFERLRKVKQAMARIKTIITERQFQARKLGLPPHIIFEEILETSKLASAISPQGEDKKRKEEKEKSRLSKNSDDSL
jgi:ribosomal protein L29